ncbi:LuxR family maltose regulon positive regulatory protein [Natranaerovirga hydrolytica]|uniref:LuxR family maltose regulon positive regulatory protein n=1 Tax=Natranaerovirga hydrolytica TaxID=680378 RepID=A0A4R1MIU0_9FIRM|nr:LuxR C-terminal-related transcriptional regulator [Natranaerovirga hydrolytica]TCK92586.1 LuxR family maltose regulon positive regulatory protein [Natranaerovirga hydrolytica]
MISQKKFLLQRKIAIPPPILNRISRKELLRDIKEALGDVNSYPSIILITAPPGYGKTTFVGEWTETFDTPVAWYDIDENDNDLNRFFTYLIHALRQYQPNLGKASMDMLGRYNALAEGGLSPEALLTPLMNELYAIENYMYLILDHYHHIKDDGIQEAMIFFLNNLPTRIKVLILSRSEPPWPLHQWQSTGQLMEIRREDLSFSREETEAFLRENTGFIPDEEDLTALQEKTEGWATALRLITGSLRKETKIREVIRNLTGDHQKILHYLTEEILNLQDDETRDFLLQTSRLSRFSPELCDTLLKRTDSHDKIQELLRENLFLIPLDEEGKWYRYHPLFKDILSHHHRRDEKESKDNLHLIAGRWFEADGDPGEALRSYEKSQDYESMARVLKKEIDNLWENEGFVQVLKWLNNIPEEISTCSMKLMVYGGFMHLLKGNVDETRRCFIIADGIGDGSDKEVLGILETLRTTFHLFNGDLKKGYLSAKKALELLPEDSYFWRISGAVVYGDVKVFSGDLAGAYEIYQDAYRWSRRSGNALSTVTVAMNILKVLWIKGELYEARRFAKETLKIAKDEGYSRLPRLGIAWIFLGEYLREEGDLLEGGRCINRGLSLCQCEGILYSMSLIFMGGQCLSRKAYDEGLEYMGRLEGIKLESGLPEMIKALNHSWKSRLFIAKSELERARRELDEVNLEDFSSLFFTGSPPVINARLLILENRYEEGENAVNALKNLPHYDISRRLMIDTLLIEAHLKELTGKSREAEETLLKAIRVGKGYGFYQTFIDEGVFVAPVFERLLTSENSHRCLEKDPGLQEYIQTIEKGLGIAFKVDGTDFHNRNSQDFPITVNESDISPSSYQELVEELTERELDILQNISRGLSNVEISNTMHLSIHTVKWHNKNIFGKLGVNNRTQAVVRGRALQLIK